MKAIFTITIILIGQVVFGQKATLVNDTLTYIGKHYVVGDTINVSYGSGNNGQFVFVYMGSGLGGITPLQANFSKSAVKVDKIYKSGGRLLIRGKVLDSNVNMLGGNKVFIEIEGAIDKKEVI